MLNKQSYCSRDWSSDVCSSDLNSASREPTNNAQWLSRYLKDSSSVRDDVPHPNYDFLGQQDFDYLITYLLSLGESNE